MKNHGISNAELSRLLNYKSKNTIQRVVSGESGNQSKLKVLKDITRLENSFLNIEEIKELEKAFNISTVGEEKHLAINEMKNLFFREDYTKETQITDIQTLKEISINEFFASIEQNENEIIITNCCWNSLVISLLNLLKRSKATKIRQYILLSDKLPDTIHYIGNILPIIYHKRYLGYTIKMKDIDLNSAGELSHNIINIRSKESNGKIKSYHIEMHGDTSGILLTEKYNLFEYWIKTLAKYKTYTKQIKTTYEQKNNASAYIKFTEFYYKMENNNSIYIYRPNFGLNYVKPEIVKKALIDGIEEFNIKGFLAEKHIAKLEEIHIKRYERLFNKKKVIQHICTESSLEEFAKTGKHADHLFAMRPYSRAERIEILKNLLYNIEHNPHFNIHLLKNETTSINIEIICYENVGVAFTSMQTAYDFSENHTEAILKQKDFINIYIDYFSNVLLKKYVQDQTETVNVFRRLIHQIETATE